MPSAQLACEINKAGYRGHAPYVRIHVTGGVDVGNDCFFSVRWVPAAHGAASVRDPVPVVTAA